jgi:hypothetical protein
MQHAFLLMSAAALAAVLGVAHSWLGERLVLGPLFAPATRQGMLRQSVFARKALRATWHLATIAWWTFAALFVVLARAPASPTGRLILGVLAAGFLATGLVILASSRGRHPAWLVFLAIAAAVAAAMR